MSALCFHITDESLAVASDSLSVRAGDRKARMLTDKIVPIRHLDGFVATTGFHRFFLAWYKHLMDLPGVHDFGALHEHVPSLLRDTWEQFEEQFDPPEGERGSVFHLGYSHAEQRFVGYRYSPWEDYKGVPMERDGLSYVPGDVEVEDVTDPDASLEDNIVEVMKALKERGDFGMGGSVHYWLFTPEGIRSTVLHRFDDYEQSIREIAEFMQ